MGHARRRNSGRWRPRLEPLEDRRLLAQFGVPWHDAQHLTVSFAPDGTAIGPDRSALFQALDAVMPTAQWQEEILRAFQTWAIQAHINFAVKADGGQPFGVPGPDQADPRFGDIRIGARPMSPEVLSISVPHDPFLSGTWSGDIILNSAATFGDGGAELFPVLLHEVGHVLGLDDSADPTSVMFAHLNNQLTALSPGDIAAVQAIYGGPRPPDPFEWASGNDTTATAAAFPVPAGYDGTTPLLIYGDITTNRDVDMFSVRPPAGYDGPVTIRLQTAGVSLLMPHLTVLDAHGAVLGSAVSSSEFGDTLQVQLPRMSPGATYYLKVEGASSDVFGIGEYALAVNFDAISTVSPAMLDTVARQTYSYLSPEDINAIFLDPQHAIFHDDHHTNDTFATAEPLTPVGGYGSDAPDRITASLADPTDMDYYRIDTPDEPAADGSWRVMTVTVRATEVNGIQPRVAVFDEDQHPIPAVVLAHGDGTYTIQVAAVEPGSDYFLRVEADPTSGKVVGNYDLDAIWGDIPAHPVNFVGPTQLGPDGTASYALVVDQAQLFDLLLGNDGAPGAAPGAALLLTIIDDRGQIVATRSAGAGDVAGGDPVLLLPGVYRATFTASVPGAALGFRLYGASVSNPIGPALDNPTARPVAETASGGSATTFASGSPYLWLALSLNPGGSDPLASDGPAITQAVASNLALGPVPDGAMTPGSPARGTVGALSSGGAIPDGAVLTVGQAGPAPSAALLLGTDAIPGSLPDQGGAEVSGTALALRRPGPGHRGRAAAKIWAGLPGPVKSEVEQGKVTSCGPGPDAPTAAEIAATAPKAPGPAADSSRPRSRAEASGLGGDAVVIVLGIALVATHNVHGRRPSDARPNRSRSHRWPRPIGHRAGQPG